MKNPAPIRTIWPEGACPPAWANWFQQLFNALAGWNKSLSKSADIDFGSIGAASEASSPITVTGARSGSVVSVTPLANTAGIFYTGVVTSDDTVTLYAKNFTAGPINPASTTFRIIVLQN